MAKNIAYNFIDQLTLPVAEGTVSGSPVVVGDLPGVALTDRDANGNAEVKVRGGPVVRVPVKGHNGTANAAIAVGEKVYYDSTAGLINKNAEAKPFGYALEAVGQGLTKTIDVLLI